MQDKKSRFLDNDDGTIYDSLTSLTWMNNDSRLDLDKEVSWDEAIQYAEEMNKKKFAGKDDWRLPTIHEASSLFDEKLLNKDFKGGEIRIDAIFKPEGSDLSFAEMSAAFADGIVRAAIMMAKEFADVFMNSPMRAARTRVQR